MPASQHVFSYGGVTPETGARLVHGCIFTRGPKDLQAHRDLHRRVGRGGRRGRARRSRQERCSRSTACSVSVMLDSNGANTTAAAAVRAAGQAPRPAARAQVARARRRPGRSASASRAARPARRARPGRLAADGAGRGRLRRPIREQHSRCEGRGGRDGQFAPTGRWPSRAAIWWSPPARPACVLLPKKVRAGCKTLQVVIDLNAVPPAGIEGIEPTDKGEDRDGVVVLRCARRRRDQDEDPQGGDRPAL